MTTLSDLSGAIGKYAPYLGAAISTVNPTAGVLISLVSKALGANKDNHEDILNKIASDPDAEFKLKKIEYDHQTELLNIALQDKVSARNREIDIIKLTGKRDWVMELIALFVVIGYFLMCYLVMFTTIDITDHDILNMLFGQLMAGFMMVLSYFFGSSNKQNK